MPFLRKSLLAAAVAALVVPATASATLTSIPGDVPAGNPSCPAMPCLVLSRTIGYQAKVGPDRGLMKVKRAGLLVSWSVKLSAPNKKQIEFFDERLGGEASASIAVLRFGKKLRARVVAVSPAVKLRPYFGKTVEFGLKEPIEVEKGAVIALSVPTWAPAFAVGLGGDTSWRAARKKGSCNDTQTLTAFPVNAIPQFYCLYRTEQLTYSARVISTP